MRRYQHLWTALLASLLTLAGCHARSATAPTAVVEPLRWEVQRVEQRTSDCSQPEPQHCATVKLEYPVLRGGPPAVRAAANVAIEKWVSRSYDEAKPTRTPAAFVRQFLAEFEQNVRDFPDLLSGGWSCERKVSVLQHDHDVLSLKMGEDVFTGGAHGIATVTFANFRMPVGQRLVLSDVVPLSAQDRLCRAAERYFRAARKLQPADNLEEAGFEFPQNGFRLNGNFAFTPQGLAFHFNPYEVASYAVGPTEFTVPYKELRGVLPSWVEAAGHARTE